MAGEIEVINKRKDIQTSKNLDVLVIDDDGTFQFDGKRYLQAIACEIYSVKIDFANALSKLIERKDFRADCFELKFTNMDVEYIEVTRRSTVCHNGNYSRQNHLIKKKSLQYLDYNSYMSVKVQSAIASRKIIQCKPVDDSILSPVGSYGIREANEFLIEAGIDQFYCVGDSEDKITKSMIQGAVDVLNRAAYGKERQWFYDEPVDFVRVLHIPKFMLRPSEAIQIAHRLGKGGWAHIDMTFVELETSKQIKK